MTTSTITPLIMAGGAGTRLWPVSRDSMPKQFIRLLDDGLSTFQATLLRVAGAPFGRPIIVTNHEFRFVAAEQMQALGIEGDIVIEPERRDSAAAVAIGALLAQAQDPAAVAVALAADHVIMDTANFRADCAAAGALAATGLIMTLGIAPTAPSSAYGYIEPGAALGAAKAFRLKRFVEKPDEATALGYLERGFLWNSGNFVFSVATMLGELERFAPEILAGAAAAIEAAKTDLDFVRLDPDAFGRIPKTSIDYAVMEKTDKAGVLAASFDWSDIGSWDSIHAVAAKDEAENVLQGRVVAVETTNSLLRSDDMLLTAIGVKDIVAVATRDAVLIAPKSEAGKVKILVESLKKQNVPEATEHLRMYRPWGWYQRIDLGARFQVKRINVKPDGKLSLQKHFHRSEHWIVVRGTAEVTLDGTVSHVHENESIYLPIGCTHRLANPGKIDLELIEVQVGSYTGEDDIIRLEDVYARS